MKKILLIILIVSFPFDILFSQDDVIARTGSSVITLEEFQNRYDFMPHLDYSKDHGEDIRNKFLYSLITEKLWAMEAFELGFDTLEAVKYSLENLKKLYIKDELYKQEVESKIKVTDEEVAKGLHKVNYDLKVNIISSKDSSEIFNVSKSIKNSTDFDSILYSRKEYEIQRNPLIINYGNLREEEIEDMLFSMKPGSISKPVKTGDGWLIFKLVEEYINPAVSPSSDHARNVVINTLKEKKAMKTGNEFLNRIIAGRSVSADRKIFEAIFANLVSILNKNMEARKEAYGSEKMYELTAKDIFQTMERMTGNSLNEEFILFDENSLTAKDFLYYLLYQKVLFNSLQSPLIKSVLNKTVKQFIEDEMIVREGIKRGLDKRQNIQNDLKIWNDYHLAQLLMKSYSDSIKISEAELKSFYLRKTISTDSLMQVNIVEILIDDLNLVEKIFDELKDGKDFRELAVTYTQREWTKKNGGEFGYFSIETGGEIGKIAASLDMGEIYGPVKVPEGYSVFQVIGKRELPDSLIESFEEKKDLLRTQLEIQKFTKLIINKTINLANKYDIKINESLLKKAELSKLNTFTYRLIGFGGKIAAFPITIPIFEWFELWKENMKLP